MFHLLLLRNARRIPRVVDPTRVDPTGTRLLRQSALRELWKRVNALKRKIRRALLEEDVLEWRRLLESEKRRQRVLKALSMVLHQDIFRFEESEDQLKQFVAWVKREALRDLAADTADEDFWLKEYVKRAYEEGQGKAFDKYMEAITEDIQVYRGMRRQFLADAFRHPVQIDRFKRLVSRTLLDLQGYTSELAFRTGRVLADGMIQGQNPVRVAKKISEEVDKVTRKRAEVIARTEIIRAHAEGQLDALERLGAERVILVAEWSTAGDDRVCHLCAPLNGMVFKVKEAHGLLPRHPNCRCTWVPEARDRVKRVELEETRKAVRKSVKLEKKSRWAGQKLPPSFTDPIKSIEETYAPVSRAVSESRKFQDFIKNYPRRFKQVQWRDAPKIPPFKKPKIQEIDISKLQDVFLSDEFYRSITSVHAYAADLPRGTIEGIDFYRKKGYFRRIREFLLEKGWDEEKFGSAIREAVNSLKGTDIADLASSLAHVDYVLRTQGFEAAIESLAERIADSWAWSSDQDHFVSSFFQIAAAEAFGIDAPIQHFYQWEQLQHAFRTNSKLAELFKDIARAHYSLTQQQLKDLGLDYIVLMRGHGVTTMPRGYVRAQLQPLNSFTTDYETASRFGKDVFVSIVPRERIFSFPASPLGTIREHEWVVIGGNMQGVNIFWQGVEDEVGFWEKFRSTVIARRGGKETKQKAIKLVDTKARFPSEREILASTGLEEVLEQAVVLPGSTAPELIEWKGQKFVKKTGNSPIQVDAEYYAAQIYKKVGAIVPDVQKYEPTSVTVKDLFGTKFTLSKWLHDGLADGAEIMSLDEAMVRLPPEVVDQVINQISEHFIVDAWLASWDVVGLSFDNILVAVKHLGGNQYATAAVRIDFGGTFNVRAQGEISASKFLGEVIELDTMRDSAINAMTARVFGHLTEEDIALQLARHYKKMEASIDLVEVPEWRERLRERLEYLRKRYEPVLRRLGEKVPWE